MELRPPDLSQEVGRALTVEVDRLREFSDLGGQDGFRLETLLRVPSQDWLKFEGGVISGL